MANLPGEASATADTVVWVGSIVFVALVVILFFVWLRAVGRRKK